MIRAFAGRKQVTEISMPKGQLEHVNITVTDPERSAKLFENLCGWHERWRGPSQLGGWTIHVGDETAYLAIYTNERAKAGSAKGVPLKHVGVLVDDLDADRTSTRLNSIH